MNQELERNIISKMAEPFFESLTPESAKRLAELRTQPSIQMRVTELAKKCNEGMLTEEERAEYESMVRLGNLFAVLKARAKALLAGDANE